MKWKLPNFGKREKVAPIPGAAPASMSRDIAPDMNTRIQVLSAPDPTPPMVPFTDGLPEEKPATASRPGGIRKTKRPEWKPGGEISGGHVVRRMPPEIKKLKEKQEGATDET